MHASARSPAQKARNAGSAHEKPNRTAAPANNAPHDASTRG